MAFWSGETLAQKLPDLVSNFNSSGIDCAAYTLTVGPEVYVTPDHSEPKLGSHTKIQLSGSQAFTIPSGQFGFILTEEKIEIPDDAIAFISMKSKAKFKGLINVSGFHVDPGYKGRLIFSVFNAGPASVHLEQGMPLFLIWYASLDQKTSMKKTTSGHDNIPTELINGIPGEVYSFRTLAAKIADMESKTIVRIHDLDKRVSKILIYIGVVSAIALSIATWQLKSYFPQKIAAPTQTQNQGNSTPQTPVKK